MLDKATVRVFAEVLADIAQQIYDDLKGEQDRWGKAVVFTSWGVALALADPAVARMICTESTSEASFEKMRLTADGIVQAMRSYAREENA